MKDFSTIDYLEPEEQSKTHSAYWYQNDVFLDGLSMYQWRAQVKLSKLAAAFCGTLLLMEDITGEVPPGAWRAIPNVGLRTSYRNTRVLHHLLEELTLITLLIKERIPGSEAESKTDASIKPVLFHILNS